jgi:hypothetical protein
MELPVLFRTHWNPFPAARIAQFNPSMSTQLTCGFQRSGMPYRTGWLPPHPSQKRGNFYANFEINGIFLNYSERNDTEPHYSNKKIITPRNRLNFIASLSM